MADDGLAVLDGTHLRGADLKLTIPNGAINRAQLIELAESEASAHIFGLPLTDSLKSAVINRISGGDEGGFLSKEFADEGSQRAAITQYLLALADELKDDPLVVSILDGSALRVFLDDEDDFAMLAENLFTDLDTEDRGKLSKGQIQDALVHMGTAMGVPPFSVSGDLLNSILKKHGAEGDEQLGQAQFAQLLQTVVQDLGDALAERPVTVLQNIKVINGSRLKKILDDENHLNTVTEAIFSDWNSTSGTGNKDKLTAILGSKATELGLPTAAYSEAVTILYNQVFSDLGEEKFSGDFTKAGFQDLVKVVLEKFAAELDANPMFTSP